MESGWKILVAAWVPDGAVRPAAARLDPARVREAIRELGRAVDAVEPRQVEPLLAWLRGWRHHWPGSFVTALGAEGDRLIAGLEQRGPDPNRYLKLRRIAVENLARAL